MADDLSRLDATAQAELVRSKQASPRELVDAAIERIDALNPRLNAVIWDCFERAREQATSGALPDGPLHGVPTLFKDLGCAVEGDPYHEGTRFRKRHGYRAQTTDHLARRFLEAGVAYLGRTNAPEFGLVPTTEPIAYGPSRNPWDPQRTTGGSSGGSAAAVASGMVPFAHANDGGGSIRIPASCCGLVGLKPSRGRTSLGPDEGQLTRVLVVEGALTRSVRDTALVLDAIRAPFAGQPVVAPAPARPYVDEMGADPGRLRIGLLVHNPLGTGPVDPEVVAATEAAARLCESLGHAVEQEYPKLIEDPALVGDFTAIWDGDLIDQIAEAEHEVGRTATDDDFEPLTLAMAEHGRELGAQALYHARHAIERVSYAVAPWFDEFDLLLTPTLAEPPVPLGTFVNDEAPILGFIRAAQFAPFCAGFNMTGQPAISLPLGTSSAGLPIGAHFVAGYGREDLLIRLAAQLEAAAPWADRIPAIHA